MTQKYLVREKTKRKKAPSFRGGRKESCSWKWSWCHHNRPACGLGTLQVETQYTACSNVAELRRYLPPASSPQHDVRARVYLKKLAFHQNGSALLHLWAWRFSWCFWKGHPNNSVLAKASGPLARLGNSCSVPRCLLRVIELW